MGNLFAMFRSKAFLHHNFYLLFTVTSESEVEEEGAEEEEEDEDETQCTKCGHDDHPETILLCDNCDAGWHLSCLRPPLLSVPEGDWICPTCEHVRVLTCDIFPQQCF